jgi:crossover junction endodeoxyribonuclease RuvC
VKVFGIDPGSERTGYGCIDTDGSRHRLVLCGAIAGPSSASFPARLLNIHRRLAGLLGECRPDCVAIESLFHAANARSALKLGHARGVAMLAAAEAGLAVAEYTPAEVKQMVKLMLGLSTVPSPHDAADALAIAICHAHAQPPAGIAGVVEAPRSKAATSWRHYRP